MRHGNSYPLVEVSPEPVGLSRRGFGAGVLGGLFLASVPELTGCDGSTVVQVPQGERHHNRVRPAQPEMRISAEHPWVVDFSKMRNGPVPSWLFGFELGIGPNNDGWGNDEAEYYTGSPTNSRVQDGALVLRAVRQHVGDRGITSARLNTQGKFDFINGKLELGIQMAGKPGPWGAAWLLPSDNKYSPQQVGLAPGSVNLEKLNGELDIVEYWGRWPGLAQASVHTYDQLTNNSNGGSKNVLVPSATSQFNTYGIIKEPGRIAFTHNGVVYFEQTPKNAGDPRDWPFDQRYHLILNLAMGGDNNPITSQGPWEMRVNHIAYEPLAA